MENIFVFFYYSFFPLNKLTNFSVSTYSVFSKLNARRERCLPPAFFAKASDSAPTSLRFPWGFSDHPQSQSSLSLSVVFGFCWIFGFAIPLGGSRSPVARRRFAIGFRTVGLELIGLGHLAGLLFSEGLHLGCWLFRFFRLECEVLCSVCLPRIVESLLIFFCQW